MLSDRKFVEDFLVDLFTTCLDATGPGSGSMIRALLRIRTDTSDGLIMGPHNSAFERSIRIRVEDTIRSSAHEYRGFEEGDIRSVCVAAARVIRSASFNPKGYFNEHLGDASAAAIEAVENFGVSAGVPPEPALRSMVMDLVSAWFLANAENPMEQIALQSIFRNEVLEKLDALTREGDNDAIKLVNFFLSRSILPSPFYRRPAQGELAPSALLDPRYSIVPFQGRQHDLSEIISWCDDVTLPPLAVGLLHGPAGRGKTRLVLETARTLQQRTDGSPRWEHAGILELDATSFNPERLAHLFESSDRIFIVIDRAERNTTEVAQLLQAAWKFRQGRHIRILLCARSAGDWWKYLSTYGEEVSQVLRAPGTRLFNLAELIEDPDERKNYYQAAYSAFGEALNLATVDTRVEKTSQIDVTKFDDPLLLNMTALAHALGEAPENQDELFDSMIDRESHYWRSLLGSNVPDESMLSATRSTMALITLVQGAPSRHEVNQTIKRILTLKGFAIVNTDRIANLLYRLYDCEDGTLGPLTPDKIGEYLVLRELQNEPRLLEIALESETPLGDRTQVRRNILTVLTRLSKWRDTDGRKLLESAFKGRFDELFNHFISVAIETGDPIGKVASDVLDGLPDRHETALIVVDDLPKESIALREFSELVTRLATSNQPAASASLEDHHAFATYRLHLSNRLYDLDRFVDALIEGMNTVILFESNLVRESNGKSVSEDDRRMALAIAYSHLAIRLAIVGRLLTGMTEEEQNKLLEKMPCGEIYNALESLDKESFGRTSLELAVFAREMASPIVERMPGRYAPEYKIILNTLSNRFDEWGFQKDAYDTLIECEKIYIWMREGTDSEAINLRENIRNFYDFEAGHATNQMNLSNRCGTLYRTNPAKLSGDAHREIADLALRHADNALSIDRRLVEQHPDAHRPHLATTLSNRSIRLFDVGRHEDAVDDSTEAIKIILGLRIQNPNLFSDSLVAAYGNRAAAFRKLDGREEDANMDEKERETVLNLIRQLNK